MPSSLKILFIALLLPIFSSPTFSQVSFTSSNLPLIVINTHGQSIPDDPKIVADMGIIWDTSGKRNTLNDPMNNYKGKIGIEIRGSSSQMFPKKSYALETRSDNVTSADVSLLGLPAENDWVLYAPYTDKTMIRDVLTYTLDAALGHYSPRCRFVELFLNGNYDGVYVLMEKIKRNKMRVDIAKLKSTDNSGVDVTGGYIIKIDKITGSGGDGWYSNYSNASGNSYYQYDYPQQEDITSAQKSYIQNYVRSMETALAQGKYTGSGSYHDFLNDSSFVDFMIVNELAKNVDGYRLSSYLYKDKNGLMNCGPIWDFNLGYGNANYYNASSVYGFQYQANLGADYWQNPFWWNKLMQDQNFVNKLKKRWTILRKKELSTERINFATDSLTNILAESQVRNYQRWPILGQYIWPNYFVGASYDAEVTWMKNWIKGRLSYLDQMWPYDLTGTDAPLVSRACTVFPNPFTEKLTLVIDETVHGNGIIKIYASDGSLIQKNMADIRMGQVQLRFSETNTLTPGLYVVELSLNGRILLTKKVAKMP